MAKTGTSGLQSVNWQKYGALLFDWDGTLVNSHRANYAAMREALAEQRAVITWPWFKMHTGTSSREMIESLAAAQGKPIDVDRAVCARDDAYLSRLGEVETIPQVCHILREAHGRLPTALATGGSVRVVLPTARALGLADLFDAIVTREDVVRGKPSPDIFLACAARLAVPPSRCLVFEDSDEGVSAACAASMDVVDVRDLGNTTAG